VLLLLSPDLVEARLKHLDLPCQRIILVLASVLTIVRRLQVWLSDEALQVEILLTSTDEQVLDQERQLLRMALQDQITSGTVRVGAVALPSLQSHIKATSRCHLTSVVDIGMRNIADDDSRLSGISLRVGSPRPVLRLGDETASLEEDDLSGWKSAVAQLMMSLLQET